MPHLDYTFTLIGISEHILQKCCLIQKSGLLCARVSPSYIFFASFLICKMQFSACMPGFLASHLTSYLLLLFCTLLRFTQYAIVSAIPYPFHMFLHQGPAPCLHLQLSCEVLLRPCIAVLLALPVSQTCSCLPAYSVLPICQEHSPKPSFPHQFPFENRGGQL